MVIDVHTHTPRFREAVPDDMPGRVNTKWSPQGARPQIYSWDEYLAAMEPVERAIVFNIAADPRPGNQVDEPYVVPVPQVNDETAAFVHAYPDRFIGFLTVHPADPHVLEEMERATQDLGLRGVKLGPNYQNFEPLGPAAFRVYRYAQDHHLPILFHQGTSPVRFADMDFTHPRHMDRIATAFPDLTVIMAHMGHPWPIDCIAVIRKHPHVWADISGSVLRPWGHYQAMLAATEWAVLDKLLFASDYPASTPIETMEKLRAINQIAEAAHLPLVPQDKIEEIINRDSLPLLGLA